MAEELMVVLKRSENLGFGFSLLGISSLPHVIYDIVENSPAAECGEVRKSVFKSCIKSETVGHKNLCCVGVAY